MVRLPRDEGRALNRLRFLIGAWLVLCCAGCSLIVASVVLGMIVAWSVDQGSANSHRAGVVLLACGVAVTAGLLLVVAGWWLKRRAKQFAEERHTKLSTRVRIRW